jgi:hypothetical protein
MPTLDRAKRGIDEAINILLQKTFLRVGLLTKLMAIRIRNRAVRLIEVISRVSVRLLCNKCRTGSKHLCSLPTRSGANSWQGSDSRAKLAGKDYRSDTHPKTPCSQIDGSSSVSHRPLPLVGRHEGLCFKLNHLINKPLFYVSKWPKLFQNGNPSCASFLATNCLSFSGLELARRFGPRTARTFTWPDDLATSFPAESTWFLRTETRSSQSTWIGKTVTSQRNCCTSIAPDIGFVRWPSATPNSKRGGFCSRNAGREFPTSCAICRATIPDS